MARWRVESNEGEGWVNVGWAGSFKTEEEAWDFIYEQEWDGPTRAYEEDEE